jgi:hypothetical protein
VPGHRLEKLEPQGGDRVSIPVLNRRTDEIPAGARYVGRPSALGNPFVIGRDGTREEVVAKYRDWLPARLDGDAAVREEFEALKVATALVCWCAPLACHADVIAGELETRSPVR